MTEEQKKVKTIAGKAGWWIALLELAFIAVLVASGFKKVNAYLLLAFIAVGVVFLFYWIRKPKSYDSAAIVKDLGDKWHLKTKEFLDTRGAQVIPLTNELSFVELPKEGRTFYWDSVKRMAVGIETNYAYPIIRRKEKSDVFKTLQKTTTAEARVKSAAEAFNIDVGDLGL